MFNEISIVLAEGISEIFQVPLILLIILSLGDDVTPEIVIVSLTAYP